MLETTGFAVEYLDTGEKHTSVVTCRGNGEGKLLCFTGHIDTVPLGTQSWHIAPFGDDIVDNRLYGHGATDMKAGVAAFVAACINLADRLAHSLGVVLVITSGEETGCEGAFNLTERANLLGEAGAMVVAEPTSNYPIVDHKGALAARILSRCHRPRLDTGTRRKRDLQGRTHGPCT